VALADGYSRTRSSSRIGLRLFHRSRSLECPLPREWVGVVVVVESAHPVLVAAAVELMAELVPVVEATVHHATAPLVAEQQRLWQLLYHLLPRRRRRHHHQLQEA